MRVQKVIKGEIFHFHVYFQLNNMKAYVKYFSSGEVVECEISTDFKYILLPKDKFQLSTWSGIINPTKLKLDKANQYEAKWYNDQHKLI